MKRKSVYTEIVKVRCTKQEKEAILQAAEQEDMTVSAFIRAGICGYKHTDSLALKVHNNLIRNEFLNQVNALAIPKKIKETIIKELTDVE